MFSEKDDAYDYRHPLYIGDWRKPIAYMDDDFANDDLDGPHMKRKITILNYHPEIEELYGHDSRTTLITVIAAHGLAARTNFQNRLVGLVANITIPAPIAMSFRRYHLEHHTFQGVDGIDPDLPLDWEKSVIRSNTLFKLMWLIFFPIINLIRSLAMFKSPQFIHPAAARFIQEHYTFDDGQETYSYYGILNKFFMNVGYHNEHHDFTKVAWSRLPEIRKIAAEYYDDLAYHTSWLMVFWNFVTKRQFGPQSRVRRSFKDHMKGRKMILTLKKTLMEE
ncbi:10089_t:CDS:2 [Acaulospora colombiana]|uniref:10089_t:CDS:1 n=1 Tax=Acaulospora colombiana TaxID=27376 RepID=A0ACA9M6I1_9GLOM|nr:10089_t:CDS:2 [Acaulospora colombiana]